MTKNKYDVIIVGAGPSGIFCAYELINKNKDLKVLLLEKGHSIEKRVCPKRCSPDGKCLHCNPCNITSGFSGAGAFSDGKLTLAASETGGDLDKIVGVETAQKLINEIDEIYTSFGGDFNVWGSEETPAIRDIRRKAVIAKMKLVRNPVKHLGTDYSYDIYTKMQFHLLKHGVEIRFNAMVSDLIEVDGAVAGVVVGDERIFSDYVVVGAGREGSTWFSDICKKHNIETCPGTVDIGVRVECRDEVMKELNDALYEAKLVYYTKTYADKVRTFCQNPSGEVALENYVLPNGNHITTVNGHAYNNPEMKTDNTNFALLVSKDFTEPFNEPLQYGAAYASIANMLAGGTILVQTYGDIKRGRRSTPERIRHGNVVPTLKDATPGDLMCCLPGRIMTDIIEMIEALDNVAPGIASDETLLYGVEVKFYSNRVSVDSSCETSLNKLYAVGDSSSWTRGLSMSSAMGLWAAKQILLRI